MSAAGSRRAGALRADHPAVEVVDRPGRLAGRAQVVARALIRRIAVPARRRAPESPRRILVVHHLLLGDTLMLTPLLAKLRARFPEAEILMALPDAFAPLYSGRPYGVRALGWNPREPAVSAVWREPGFDLAFVPGDNRFSWLALALGSRWITAFAGDRPARKSWPVNELRPFPTTTAAWTDITATLVDGPPPAPYECADWPAPPVEPFASPVRGYAVLHVGASTRLKQWEPARWSALAAALAAQGLAPVWSAGRGEEAIVRACDQVRVIAATQAGWTCRSSGGSSPTPRCWSRPTPESRIWAGSSPPRRWRCSDPVRPASAAVANSGATPLIAR